MSFFIELFCVVTLQYQILVRIAIAYFIIEKKKAAPQPWQAIAQRFCSIGNLLREEMKFFSCRLVCQDVSLEWYAAKIILRIPIIDKEASTYRTLSDGERVLSFIKFRRDIEEEFFIAKDKESITDFVVSELFVDICKRNGLLIDFKEV